MLRSYWQFFAVVVLMGSYSVRIQAQSNGWLADGTRWMESYACGSPGTPICGDVVRDLRLVEGDTMINGHVYKKVFRSGIITEQEYGLPPGSCSDDTVFVHHNGVPSIFLRDSLGSMYRLLNGVESLLYDMDLEVGDTVPLTALWTLPNRIVASIDSVVVEGSFRKRFHTGEYTLIEGVGWSRSGTYGFLTPTHIGYCSYGPFCYSVGDTSYFPVSGVACSVPTSIPTILDASSILQLHPNPASEHINLSVPLGAMRVRVLSTTGTVVWSMDDPAAGDLSIPVSELATGAYVIHVDTRSLVVGQRFMVVR